MEMICKADISRNLGDGVWVGEMDTSYLPLFGKPLIKNRKRTIIGLTGRPKDDNEGYLEFDLRDAVMLAQGSDYNNAALFIFLDEVGSTLKDQLVRDELSDRHKAPYVGKWSPSPSPSRSGDSAFLTACKEEGMPEAMVKLAESFFTGLHEFSDDKLVEGLARKWVTKPNNFVAITIQNRNKFFAIHVRKTTALETLLTLDVRDDRPGYSRFWLKDENQLADAIIAAKASYRST